VGRVSWAVVLVLILVLADPIEHRRQRVLIAAVSLGGTPGAHPLEEP
jgi:hypothetical protein